MSGVTRPSYSPQTAYIRVKVDGRISNYFEWMGAASYTSDQRTSAMHGKQFLLDAVYAGVDATSVCGRLDFAEGLPEGDYRLVINLEASKAEKTGKSIVRLVPASGGSQRSTCAEVGAD